MSPENREKFKAYVRSNIIGPAEGVDETIDGRVSLRYMSGILYPKSTGKEVPKSIEELQDIREEADGSTSSEEPLEDKPMSSLNERLQSSAGITFSNPNDLKIRISVSAGRYHTTKKPKEWKREELSSKGTISLDTPKVEILDGLASVRLENRTALDGTRLCTVTVVNEQKNSGKGMNESLILWQVSMKCSLDGGLIPSLPLPNFSMLSEEDQEFEVLFGGRRPFARGHGASASWSCAIDAYEASSVSLEFMPEELVHSPRYDTLMIGCDERAKTFGCTGVFGMSRLADPASERPQIFSELREMVSFYREWIESLELDESFAQEEWTEAENRLTSRAKSSADRMEAGIRELENDEVSWKSFQLANLAMLMQLAHRERREKPRDLGQADTSPIRYLERKEFNWRPFQIAYTLQILDSLVNDTPHRDTVDILWFSTGGGKTEAYLFVAAFEMIRRRLVHGSSGGGTAVISRYTYRFLTSDQFERTSALLCALETIRKENPSLGLGEKPFTVGLWVGGTVTPNRFNKAHEEHLQVLERDHPAKENPFQVQKCPWCGTRLLPEERILKEGNPDMDHSGFQSSQSHFKVRCPEKSCSFHDELPFRIVDQQIYNAPPTFLIGTIDKFALMPWGEPQGKLLGGGGGKINPPSLIIQDELHLVSGPLGTLAAIYEAGLETVIRSRNEGWKPKIIAATATIRNARSQSRRLYARDCAIFPPQGLDFSDSFFSRVDPDAEKARLYLGCMAQSGAHTTSKHWLLACMLQAALECGIPEKEIDPYWTLLAYHNTRRELGRTRTAIHDEIATRIKVYNRDGSKLRELREEVLELSAGSVDSVSAAKEDLSRKHQPGRIGAFDLVPCTNMISVGIDIDRLGLMAVNGQPRLTAEYIQATSRIGRKHPGLVVTLYARDKARDRSHYEGFRDYHATLYKKVEPCSITPGSIPATRRALHAALALAVRHSILSSDRDASGINDDRAEVDKIVSMFRKRCLAAYPVDGGQSDERAQIIAMLDLRLDEWKREAQNKADLQYGQPYGGTAFPTLLGIHGANRGCWQTMTSMRNVDNDVELYVS